MSEQLQEARSNSPFVKKILRLERSVGLNASSSNVQSGTGGIFDSINVVLQQLSQWLGLLLAQPTADMVQVRIAILPCGRPEC